MTDFTPDPESTVGSKSAFILSSEGADPLGEARIAPLTILYQDDEFIAIDKPEGTLTHPSRIASDRSASAMERLRDQLGRWVYPIHRLDRATSGVLFFALSADAARLAQPLFAQGKVYKRYLAVTRGYAPESAEVNRALKEHPDRITDQKATPNKPSQPAHTSLVTWARCSLDVSLGKYPMTRLSLVEAQPRTGRRHQIRRHLAGLSYPLVGDTSHGRGELNRLFRSRFSCHRLLLSAFELSLPHPRSEVWLTIEAPIGGIMGEVCRALFSPDHHSMSEGAPSRVSLDWLKDPQELRQRLASE